MSKKYTAGEMRQMAGYIEYERSVQYFSDVEKISAMLRQAADALERERKHEYEYAARYFYPSGVIATAYIFDNQTDAELFSVSRDGAKKIICRRSVGEWEEVK